MNLDIAALVKGSLETLGCDPSVIGNLDSHSTISFDFDDSPSFHVAVRDDQVWMWSRICEYNESIMQMRASAILEHLIETSAFIANHHPSLAVNEGFMELKVLVAEPYLQNAEQFAEALHGFFDRVEAFNEIVTR